MVSSCSSSSFQILNAFCRHLLAFRISLDKVREVMGIFMKACIVSAWVFGISPFILWREGVLRAFVKSQMSGEVCVGKVVGTNLSGEQGDQEL